ncbi:MULTISPECIES: metalloregulator ArsR/SmtB family transcription factor [unclassified Pseudofrankia]|uniref:helix-turn-helix transcriptional regulator n=1 Tax=unclassified Pseudofrankia TaxID=2994372 RepID=UPI0008DA3B47|nr:MULTISPECIES: helix-turn-helix domain-containing protein [unclassified Pseudofrankia]MDT3441388.1 helix-turn-helix domain-containing protein [Pseudofrankia sp. BMG5.37]OHV48039.1 hypothetical protein BCD48_16725 [Pseudofrankia sp. BMG5.36]
MANEGERARVDGSSPDSRRLDVLRVLKAAGAPRGIAEIADELGVHPNTIRFHLDTLVANGQAERAPSDRRRPGRPRALFRAVRGMDPGGPRHYRVLAEILMESVAAGSDPSTRAIEAGRAWGRRVASTASVGAAHGAVGDGAGAGADDNGADDDGAVGDSADVGRGRGDGSRLADAASRRQPVARLVRLLDDLGFAPEPPGVGVDAGSDLRVRLRHCPFLELAETRAQVVCPVHLGVMRGALDAWKAPLTVDRLEPFAEPDLCVAYLVPVGGRS